MILLRDWLHGVDRKFICMFNLHEDALNACGGITWEFHFNRIIFNFVNRDMTILNDKGVKDVF